MGDEPELRDHAAPAGAKARRGQAQLAACREAAARAVAHGAALRAAAGLAPRPPANPDAEGGGSLQPR